MPTGPNISVKLNFPRKELLVASYRRSAPARLFYQYTNAGGDWPQRLTTAPLNTAFWHEPNTGVVMLRPNVLMPSFWDGPLWYTPILKGIQDYLFGANNAISVPPNIYSSQYAGPASGTPFMVLAGRASATTPFVDNGFDPRLSVLLATYVLAVCQFARSLPTLSANEGFSLWIHPPGTSTDRATDYIGFGFGGRYYLHFKDGGTYQLYCDLNYGMNPPQSPNWQLTAEWAFKGGHVDHTEPFMLTIIPFGYQYISFIFKAQSVDAKTYSTKLPTDQDDHFLYDTVLRENRIPRYDPLLGQYIKTEAEKITVCVRQSVWQYAWGISRVRYSTGVQPVLRLYPETMPHVTPNTPVMSVEGFQGQNDGSGAAQINFSMAADNPVAQTFGTYIPNSSTLLSGVYQLTASGSGLYSPEVWSQDFYCQEVDFTPTWTPIDVSNDWRYLRFQRTVSPDPTKAEIKLRDDSRYNQLIVLGGTPINVTVTGPSGSLSMFDGYCEKRQPTVQAYNAMVSTIITAKDMWARLDEKYTGDYTFLEGMPLGQVFFGLLQDAGFAASQIWIDDPDGSWSTLNFEGFQDPNDRITVNPDATVGDVIRHFIKIFWVVPIRCLWTGTQWHLYTQPTYNYVADTPPAKIFSTRSFNLTDTLRWTKSIYHIKSDMEFDIEPIEFNALIGRAVSGVAAHGEGIQSSIPNNQPNDTSSWAWRTVNDPTSPWFVGRTKLKYLNPPEIVLAQDQTSLDMMTYAYWQRYSKKLPRVEFNAEWQPGIDVDNIIWIVGTSQTADALGTQFPPVFGQDSLLTSYGAWRIDHLDVECRWDRTGKDDTFSYTAKYTCVFVGKATGWFGQFTGGPNGGAGYHITQMWTTDANLPI